jgi:hypothetical protein
VIRQIVPRRLHDFSIIVQSHSTINDFAEQTLTVRVTIVMK